MSYQWTLVFATALVFTGLTSIQASRPGGTVTIGTRHLAQMPTFDTFTMLDCPPVKCPPRLLHNCSATQKGPRSLSDCQGQPNCDQLAYKDWAPHCNVDMQGHDLGEVPGHKATATNIRACADSCASTPDCKAFTYSYGNESTPGTFNCWPKTRGDLHDDTDMRLIKRPDCCIDVVTVLRPPPPNPSHHLEDVKLKIDILQAIMTGFIGLVGVYLTIWAQCMQQRNRKYEAAHALFHSYAEVDKYVDQLWRILYYPPPLDCKEIARRCVNNCDMLTGQPWAEPPSNSLMDLALAKAKVNAWLDDICYHTQGVGDKPKWCSLHRALQLITKEDACDYRFEIRRCLEVVAPFNWVWHQLNTPADRRRIERHKREVESEKLLAGACGSRGKAPFSNAFEEFLEKICTKDRRAYVATSAQSTDLAKRRRRLELLKPFGTPALTQALQSPASPDHGGEPLLIEAATAAAHN